MDDILREKLSKSAVAMKKWLNDCEEVDCDKSQYAEGYFALRIKERGEFILTPGDMRKGRIIFAKETEKGMQYLYDSVQLYRDWDTTRKDFSKLSALDINIYLHLVISLLDDNSAVVGIAQGLGEDITDVIHKYLTLNPDAKSSNAAAMMKRCASFFLNPYLCYTAFYRGYTRMNMAREAGIAREMTGRTFDLK